MHFASCKHRHMFREASLIVVFSSKRILSDAAARGSKDSALGDALSTRSPSSWRYSEPDFGHAIWKPVLNCPKRFLDEINMLFYSFFKSLVGKDVVVELKNDLSVCGTLHSVDQYLNFKLSDIQVMDGQRFPYMLSVKNCFIRGSVVRYVQLPVDDIDVTLLQDATRKEASSK